MSAPDAPSEARDSLKQRIAACLAGNPHSPYWQGWNDGLNMALQQLVAAAIPPSDALRDTREEP